MYKSKLVFDGGLMGLEADLDLDLVVVVAVVVLGLWLMVAGVRFVG